MADPISPPDPAKRESGIQRSGDLKAAGESARAMIQEHNRELLAKAGDLFALPIGVLTEQRDRALSRLAGAEAVAEQQRQELVAEQDRFISYLMTDHEQKLAELKAELELERAELRRQALRPNAARESVGSEGVTHDAASLEQLEALRQALDAATAEIEETRADASRLQEERDEAIRATDDARLELLSEVEAARDEVFQLETRLDEANRLLEDARDQARDEAYRFNEDLSEARRELDERNEEVRRLRARLATHVAEHKPSMPPPPELSQELDRARAEAQQLRQQLIQAKRELARVARERELAQGPRSSTPRPGGGARTALGVPRPGSAPATQRFDPRAPEPRHVTPLGFSPPEPTTKRG